MRVQVFKTWDRVHSSFWFLPALMASGTILLAFATVALDTLATDWITQNWGVTFNGGAEGASALLGAIAGSMITIAGVVFSMTLVALSLTSSQLGPRLLRSFMRDTTTQVVLGTFVATFLYCLLVLRTIRHTEELVFVPHLSVSVGVLLAVVSVGVLIFFIHHVSVSIQANEIVARVGKELIAELGELFPENIGQARPQTPIKPPTTDFLARVSREAQPIDSTRDGYLQFIDGEALMTLAVQENLVIELIKRPGHYIVASRPLARIWPGHKVTEQMIECVNAAFALGNQRTSGQDIEFAVNQLVEIAVRALSPGINDPFTAMTCVDRLGSALCRLAQQDMPSPYRYDNQDQLRIITPVFTFPDITDAAFNQIRQYSRSSAAVTIRLLETLAEIAKSAYRPEDCHALLKHANMIVSGISALPEDADRQAVKERFQSVTLLLSKSSRARL